MKKKCWPEFNLQLSFKYFVIQYSIQKLYSKVSDRSDICQIVLFKREWVNPIEKTENDWKCGIKLLIYWEPSDEYNVKGF